MSDYEIHYFIYWNNKLSEGNRVGVDVTLDPCLTHQSGLAVARSIKTQLDTDSVQGRTRSRKQLSATSDCCYCCLPLAS